MKPSIKFYFSILSPWTYMGYAEFLRIAKQYDAKIIYKPINLMTIFNEMGGAPASKRHTSRQSYRWVELQRWAKFRNIPINLQPKYFPFDAQLANCVVLSLIERDIDPAPFMQKGFHATWHADQNLADPIVIADILQSLHLPADEIMEQAQSPAFAARYEQNTQDAIADEAFGMPFMILNGEPFWGQDRLDFLEDALKTGVTLPKYTPRS